MNRHKLMARSKFLVRPVLGLVLLLSIFLFSGSVQTVSLHWEMAFHGETTAISNADLLTMFEFFEGSSSELALELDDGPTRIYVRFYRQPPLPGYLM